MNVAVNWFFEKETKWQDAYQELREIVLTFNLIEELKWGCPCYIYNEKNVVLIHGFKDYCALLFMKGAILRDANQILIQQTANVQSARQLRFKNLTEILNQKTLINSFIKNAIEVEDLGLKVDKKETIDYKIPAEFQIVLNEMAELKIAFEELTPGRQRGYLLYFSSAKQARTRDARIEKYIPKILSGKGLDD